MPNIIRTYEKIEKGSQAEISEAYGKPDIKILFGTTTLHTYSIIDGVFFQFCESNGSMILPSLMGEDTKLNDAEADLIKKTKLELIIKSEKIFNKYGNKKSE